MAETPALRVDPNAITTAPDQEPFTLNPIIRDILRTRYCTPGAIFLVEGIEIIPISRTGRWQTVRLVLGDGDLCMQALLSAECHRFVETGEVSIGFYIKVDKFDLEWENIDAEEQESGALPPPANQKMVYLALRDITTIGWNESYRAMVKQYRAESEMQEVETSPAKTSPAKDKGKGKMKQESPHKSQPVVPVDTLTVKAESPLKSQPVDTVTVKEEPPPPSSSGYGGDFDMEDAFDSMEKLLFPSVKNTSTPMFDTTSHLPKIATSSRTEPVALPRDWTNRQTPLKLTTLHAIPSLPYAQNWMCNVLVIIADLSPVEASYLPPYKQRTARLADPSTAKLVHLTVFLDPEAFNPAIGAAVLLTGVKNHRFDGGSLKKYASDGRSGTRWWFEDPVDMAWCDVPGIKAWWQQMQSYDG